MSTRQKVSRISVAVVLSIALIIGAELSLAAPAAVNPSSIPKGPTPQYGGILKLTWSSPPPVFGYPAETPGLNYINAVPCLETLLDFDSSQRFQPTALATGLATAPDGRSVRITIRKGVKFHDGTDFNAAAVKWNLDSVMKARMLGTENWTSIDVLDDSTVRINLRQPDSTFIGQMGRALGMQISPTAFEKNGKDWAKLHPVGTGPFKFKSFERDVSLKYEKFDGYWQKGLPYLDGVECIYIKDPMVQMAAFRAGEVTVIFWAKGKQASDLKALGYNVVDKMSSLSAIIPDSANPDSPLANKKVREALEHATNREAIAKLGYGFWRAADQPCTPEVTMGYNRDIKPREYNPAKAKQLLAEAGYPNGFKTRIIMDQGLGVVDPMTAVQGQWKEVGVDVTLENVPRAKYEEYRAKGWHNGFIHSGQGQDPVYIISIDRFISSAGNVYVSTQRPPQWDKISNETRAAADPDTMAKLTRAMVKTLHDEASFLSLWAYTDPCVLDKSVRDAGFLTGRFHWHLWSPEKAWLSR
jgi:peptide/nickel transport system substrate-binding protein